jgi:hypothetical protein
MNTGVYLPDRSARVRYNPKTHNNINDYMAMRIGL